MKNPKEKVKNLKSKKVRLLHFLLGLLTVMVIVFVFEIYFFDKIFPGISIAGIKLVAQTPNEARLKVTQQINSRLYQPINLTYQSQTFQINLASASAQISVEEPLSQAMEYGRTKFYLTPQNLELPINLDINAQIAHLTQAINQPPIEAQLKVEGDQINVTPSQDGLVVDEAKLRQTLVNFLNTGKLDPQIPTKTISPRLSYQTALNIKKSLDQIKLEPLKLTFKDQSWTLSLAQVIELLDFQNSQPMLAQMDALGKTINLIAVQIGETQVSDSQIILDPAKMEVYLKGISAEIDQPVKEPLFNFDGQKVTEFQPPQDGQKLNISKSALKITQALVSQYAKHVPLVVELQLPKNKLANDLGIKEIVGEGLSYFAGSIPNRIFNVGLAASRINGVLIPPGETFSFVNTVGDISGASGYKQAYVIKNGRTVLDDGGGVCQVSTTLFRAVLNSGLPIVSRTAHAYRVGYYEQGFPPGMDATIFSPTVDFKFKNDTGSHILIQAQTAGTSLSVNLYGTSDGRVATLSRPITTNITPAPPELRQDDPTLPKGTVKQVDFAASGANVVFSRTVIRNGQTLISESFRSNYRPWQAVYLVGTQ